MGRSYENIRMYAHLQDLQKSVGDLEVKSARSNGGARDACPPRIEYLCKISGREWIVRFWSNFNGEEKKGEQVVRIY